MRSIGEIAAEISNVERELAATQARATALTKRMAGLRSELLAVPVLAEHTPVRSTLGKHVFEMPVGTRITTLHANALAPDMSKEAVQTCLQALTRKEIVCRVSRGVYERIGPCAEVAE